MLHSSVTVSSVSPLLAQDVSNVRCLSHCCLAEPDVILIDEKFIGFQLPKKELSIERPRPGLTR